MLKTLGKALVDTVQTRVSPGEDNQKKKVVLFFLGCWQQGTPFFFLFPVNGWCGDWVGIFFFPKKNWRSIKTSIRFKFSRVLPNFTCVMLTPWGVSEKPHFCGNIWQEGKVKSNGDFQTSGHFMGETPHRLNQLLHKRYLILVFKGTKKTSYTPVNYSKLAGMTSPFSLGNTSTNKSGAPISQPAMLVDPGGWTTAGL